MNPTTTKNSNTKRLRYILVISVILLIFITYSGSGTIDSSFSALPFSRNVLNVTKSFYKDLQNQSTTNKEVNVTTSLIMKELIDADNKSSKASYGDLKSEQPSEKDREKQPSSTENKFHSENVKGFKTTIAEKYPSKDVTYTAETSDVTNSTDVYSHKDSTEIPKRDITNSKLDLLKWKKINTSTNSRESKKTEIWTKRKQSKQDFRDAFRDRSQFNKSVYDIMSMKSIHFDKAFKNPCWIGEGTNGLINDGKLHCLPYFYLIGVKKSGTTDFMSKIRKHPEYCAPLFGKESQWISRRRFGIRVSKRETSLFQRRYDIRKPEFFSALFDIAALCILHQPSERENNKLFYKKISAEASPSVFHMHTKWEMLPGNENQTEPRYTNFHYIKHLTPNVKIIVLFRDPVSRLYSDFLFTTKGKYGDRSPEVFHKEVLTSIEAYNRCFSHSSTRSCVYNNTLKEELKQKGVRLFLSFNAGFYAVLMKDVLSVFGNSQVLPIYMPDYTTRMEETLRKTFSFLDMAEVSKQTMKKMLTSKTENVAGRRKSVPMLNSTMAILNAFYKPYNEQMASLMNDSRYLFLQH